MPAFAVIPQVPGIPIIKDDPIANAQWKNWFLQIQKNSNSVFGAGTGGTGFTSYAIGDTLYAATATTLAKLAAVATGNALISGGVTTAPSWGKIALATHVSGTLPVANGGTGATTLADGGLVIGNAAGAVEVVAAGATTDMIVGGGALTAPVWTTATGSGAPVRENTPTLITPVLGVATGTSFQGIIGNVTPAAVAATTVTGSGSITSHNATAIPAGGTAGVGMLFSSTANFGTFFGSGVPTLTGAQGALYLRSDGSSTSTRAYINTDGGTTWTSLTTAA